MLRMYETITEELFEQWLAALAEDAIIGDWSFESYRYPVSLFLEEKFPPERFAVGIERYCHLNTLTYYPCPPWMQAIGVFFCHTPVERGSLLVTKRAFLRQRERMKEREKACWNRIV